MDRHVYYDTFFLYLFTIIINFHGTSGNIKVNFNRLPLTTRAKSGKGDFINNRTYSVSCNKITKKIKRQT